MDWVVVAEGAVVLGLLLEPGEQELVHRLPVDLMPVELCLGIAGAALLPG